MVVPSVLLSWSSVLLPLLLLLLVLLQSVVDAAAVLPCVAVPVRVAV